MGCVVPENREWFNPRPYETDTDHPIAGSISADIEPCELAIRASAP